MEPLALLFAVISGLVMQGLAFAGATLLVLHQLGMHLPVVLILNANQLASLYIGSHIILNACTIQRRMVSLNSRPA